MERKLATLQAIKSIAPIIGADAIEVATVKGWHCVVKKGDFEVGDWCIYFEVDSVLPELAPFEFLRSNCWNERYKGFRIRTIKLRGQVSQGLVMPLNIIPEEFWIVPGEDLGRDVDIGYDFTEILEVQKYLPEVSAHLQGSPAGSFPTYIIPKTDEERVQNIPGALEFLQGLKVYITEKIDGCSSTFYMHENKFGVCSRNLELKEDDKNTYWEIARKYNIEVKLRNWYEKFGFNIALQGEIVGPGIQKNKYNLAERTIRFFNAYNISEHSQCDFVTFMNVLEYLNLDSVPILETDVALTVDPDYWIKKSEGYSVLNNKIKREGIVVRSMENIIYPSIGKFSFKAINPKFLLKYDTRE